MGKNPVLAALLSFIIPGAGLVYCNAVFRGIILFLLWVSVTWNAIANMKTTTFIYYAGLSVVLWLYAIFESKRMAIRDHGRKSNRL